MSQKLLRAESAPRESCVQMPAECLLCDEVEAAGFGGCCTRHCEEAAHRLAAAASSPVLRMMLADPGASAVTRAYARAELRRLLREASRPARPEAA